MPIVWSITFYDDGRVLSNALKTVKAGRAKVCSQAIAFISVARMGYRVPGISVCGRIFNYAGHLAKVGSLRLLRWHILS